MSDKFFQINEKTWVNPKYFQFTKNTEYVGNYFFIIKIPYADRKTPIYYIFEHNTNCIGEIKWYAPWRKFCFYPDKDTVWDSKCLTDLLEQLDKINLEYKEKRLNNGNI